MRGFTILEMLIVAAIVGILVALFAPGLWYDKHQDQFKTNITTLEVIGKRCIGDIEYYVSTAGSMTPTGKVCQ
jgi:prepilin-type N-terminal cleavage/methylation domain-containing protein